MSSLAHFDVALIQKVQQEMKEQPLLIADGHHRYEATLNYRNQMRNKRGQWTGREAFNYIMTYFANLNDENVVILPTHRPCAVTAAAVPEVGRDAAKILYLEQYPKTPEGKGWFLKALKNGAKKQRLIGASFKRDPRYLSCGSKTRGSCSGWQKI
jgi:hypothetical protein